MSDGKIITYYVNESIKPQTVDISNALERLRSECLQTDSWAVLDGKLVEPNDLTQQNISQAEIIDLIVQVVGG